MLSSQAGALAPGSVWRIDWAVLATIGSRVVVIAAGILTSVVTARFLQPAGRGEYFLAVTTAQMLAQFANVGLPSSNTFFVARDRSNATALVANSLWVSLVVPPVLGVAWILFSKSGLWPSALDASTLWFGVALAPLILFNLLGSNLLVGLNELGAFNAVQIASAVILLPLMLFAGQLHFGPHGFLGASVLGWTLTACLVMVLLRRRALGPLGFRPDVFRQTLGYSTRAYLATLAGFLVLRINVFTLNAAAGSEQVGYYSIASQIADTVAILPQSIALVLFPLLVSRDSDREPVTVEHAVRTAVVLGSICVVLWFAAAPAIRLAFGERFAPAAPVVQAMLPGVLLVGVTSIVSQYLAANGMPPSVVAVWFGGVALTAIMGRVLVFRYGAIGAGATLSLTYLVMLIALTTLAVRMAKRQRAARGILCSTR